MNPTISALHSGTIRQAGLAVLALLIAIAGASAIIYTGAAQEAESGLVIVGVGGNGSSFTAVVESEDDAVATMNLEFSDNGSEAADLPAGDYMVMPQPAEDFGYRGWAAGTEASCPESPTNTEATIPVSVDADSTTVVCIYHAEGTADVSQLQSNDAASASPTPEAPSTGTGLAADGNSGASAIAAAGALLIVLSAVAFTAARRNDR